MLCACGQSEKPETTKAATAKDILTDSLKQTVTIDTVAMKPVTDDLTLNGTVTFDQEKVAQVVPPFGGTVEQVRVSVNDYVKQGTVLATLRSSEAANYEQQTEAARRQLAVAQRSLSATRKMYESGMASDKELMEAQRDVDDAQAEVNKQRALSDIYHFTGKAVYQIKAPVSGFVVERNINPGTLLRSDQGEPVFTISGLADVWVMADVYEGDISKVKENAPVEISTLAYPNEVFHGEIDRIYNVLDEESKTMKVRVRLSNKDFRLKPGMFANVVVQSASSDHALPCIHDHALVFEDGQNYVVAVDGHERMSIRRVEVYTQHGGRAYLSSGVEPGERIINGNALLIYNALRQD